MIVDVDFVEQNCSFDVDMGSFVKVDNSTEKLKNYYNKKETDDAIARAIDEIKLTPGPEGPRGEKGDPGYTPIKNVDYFDGADGKDGYTPQKNIDYFDGKDGEPGKDGVSCTHEWNGTTLIITSASGTSSADLKGEKGDKGERGIQGIQGPKGDTGATGSQGPKGDTGETGPQGPKGDTGEIDYSRLNNYLPLSGGTMTGELVFDGGDKTGGSKIVLATGKGQITNSGTQTLFGFTNGSALAVGHSSYILAVRGSATRPKYNSKELALLTDIPTVPTLNTETWTFTLEDGSTVTKAVYIG